MRGPRLPFSLSLTRASIYVRVVSQAEIPDHNPEFLLPPVFSTYVLWSAAREMGDAAQGFVGRRGQTKTTF